MRIQSEVLVPGAGLGRVLATDEPLGLWGGLDPETGQIIDRRHPLCGMNVAGRVLSLPFGRGSCSASGVLLEAVANRTGPAAILVASRDPVLGLGAVLADELLGQRLPVVLLDEAIRRTLNDLWHVSVSECGEISAWHEKALSP